MRHSILISVLLFALSTRNISAQKSTLTRKVIRDDLFLPRRETPYSVEQLGLNRNESQGLTGRGFFGNWFQNIANFVTDSTQLLVSNTFEKNSPKVKNGKLKDLKWLLKKKNGPGWINMGRYGEYSGGDWYPGRPLKVIIHGYTPNSPLRPYGIGSYIYGIGNEYASKPIKYNVIIVDWLVLSTTGLTQYKVAADSTKEVGEEVANFLIDIKNRNLFSSWDDVHLIGHSLGAHTAGVAGYYIQGKASSSIARITGIDPAGPNFHESGNFPSDLTRVLDSSDAKFVDVMHCNMGRLGTPVQSGHADFYPNGGVQQRPCVNDFKENLIQLGSCSHNYCATFFQLSIARKYLACPCSSWSDYRLSSCSRCTIEDGGTYMGEPVGVSARGKYYLIGQ